MIESYKVYIKVDNTNFRMVKEKKNNSSYKKSLMWLEFLKYF